MKRHLCIGCGVCAAVCPAGRLGMQFGEDGCYAVLPEEECSRNCGLCDAVCPFADTGHNEDTIAGAIYAEQADIAHDPECGYFLSCSVGYCSDDQRRLNSASGGAATAFLNRLLTQGDVDRVVCVTRDPGSAALFKCSIVDSAAGLDKAAKSAYYPVEFSSVLREVLTVPARYAVVCLPCVAKAIRLAQMRLPALKERIVVIIGLVCGHGVSSHFGDYVAALAGAPRGSAEEIIFRTKSPHQPSSDFGTLVRWRNAQAITEERTVHWTKGLSEAWTRHWFTAPACLYCDDAYAECADIVFMDAWLPEFVSDYKGTNLILTRSQWAKSEIESAAAAGEMNLSDIELQRLKTSQQGVRFKRERLAHRLWLAAKERRDLPTKRVSPEKAPDWYAAMMWDAEAKRAAVGPTLWKRSGELREFQTIMRSIDGDLPGWIRVRRLGRRILDRVCRGFRR